MYINWWIGEGKRGDLELKIVFKIIISYNIIFNTIIYKLLSTHNYNAFWKF